MHNHPIPHTQTNIRQISSIFIYPVTFRLHAYEHFKTEIALLLFHPYICTHAVNSDLARCIHAFHPTKACMYLLDFITYSKTLGLCHLFGLEYTPEINNVKCIRPFELQICIHKLKFTIIIWDHTFASLYTIVFIKVKCVHTFTPMFTCTSLYST